MIIPVDLVNNKDKNCVIFGGSNLTKASKIYHEAYHLSEKLAQRHYNIITGSGTGIMEAANKASYLVNSKQSIGFKVNFRPPQKNNLYLGREMSFKDLTYRKKAFYNVSHLFICFPGGIGSIDELFSFLALKQANEIKENKTFILFNIDNFWSPLMNFLNTKVIDEYQLANQQNLNSIKVLDNQNEVLEFINHKK